MARNARPTDDQLPLLKELAHVAALRQEINRLYLTVFHRALRAGTRPSVIARYARISPQAANSMRVRLESSPPDPDGPASIRDALQRAHGDAGLDHG